MIHCVRLDDVLKRNGLWSDKKGINSQTYTPEQLINKLRETEIHINRGIAIAEASRLKKLVADLSLDKAIRRWLNRAGVKMLFIEPGSPWENGYIESFNGKLRDELLNWEIFTTLAEAKVLIEQWRREYNQMRPHSALGYRPPAPEAIIPITQT